MYSLREIIQYCLSNDVIDEFKVLKKKFSVNTNGIRDIFHICVIGQTGASVFVCHFGNNINRIDRFACTISSFPIDKRAKKENDVSATILFALEQSSAQFYISVFVAAAQ